VKSERLRLCLLYLVFVINRADGGDAIAGDAECPWRLRLKKRVRRWKNSTTAPWQSLVNDKLGGYAFARSIGVRTPEIYACSEGVPQLDGAAWKDNFVSKPLDGYNSQGILIAKNGKTLHDGKSVSQAGMEMFYKSYPKTPTKAQLFLVEERITPSSDVHQRKGVPADFKWFVFGEKIAGVHYMERWSGFKPGMGQQRSCTRAYDANWKPLPFPPYYEKMCDIVPRPTHFEEMKRVVTAMGKKLGVHYRIDMFVTRAGPVLGEFTPWSAAGIGSQQWQCLLSGFWEGVEGGGRGPLPPIPDILRDWNDQTPATEKCKRVQMLQKKQHRPAAQHGTKAQYGRMG